MWRRGWTRTLGLLEDLGNERSCIDSTVTIVKQSPLSLYSEPWPTEIGLLFIFRNMLTHYSDLDGNR